MMLLSNRITPDTTLFTAIRKWLDEKVVQGQLNSAVSRDTYWKVLVAMERVIGRDTPVKYVGRQDIRRWYEHYAGKVASRTLAKHIAIVRDFFRGLQWLGAIEEDPSDGLRSPLPTKTLPRALSVEQVTTFLDGIAGGKKPQEQFLTIRDRAIFEVIYAGGLRISEAASLFIEHLDMEAGRLLILGKGGKERMVPLGTSALEALRSYLALRAHAVEQRSTRRSTRPTTVDSGPLWTTVTGQGISSLTIRKRFKLWRDRAGLPGTVTPHALRHSCATHLIMGGASTRVVQEILGHACLTTTQVYIQLHPRHLLEVHKRCHPREQMTPQSEGGEDESNAEDRQAFPASAGSKRSPERTG